MNKYIKIILISATLISLQNCKDVVLYPLKAIGDSIPCHDIVDIYYNPQIHSNIYIEDKCPYTITVTNQQFSPAYISRGNYDQWAWGYIQLGLTPPFSKRRDTNLAFRH